MLDHGTLSILAPLSISFLKQMQGRMATGNKEATDLRHAQHLLIINVYSPSLLKRMHTVVHAKKLWALNY